MRFEAVLPFAALASAIVLPDEQVFAQIAIEDAPEVDQLWNRLPSFKDVADKVKKPFVHEPETLKHPLDEALSKLKDDGCTKDYRGTGFEHPSFDYQVWIEEGLKRHQLQQQDDHPPHPPPPHHGPPHPPHDGPPHHGPPPKGPHKRPGKGPHHGPGKKIGLHFPHHHPHHHKVNLTIYELISKSNYTKILASYIDKHPELVKELNSTKANYTLYAPVDWAFKRLPKDFKPSKELIKKVLSYHVSPGFYPTFRLAFSKTAPTLLELDSLGGNPQRVLAKWLGFFRGFRLNYYSKVLAPNIGTSNGIVHGISNILLPPPPALAIVSALPGTFSTLELGLTKAGLIDAVNSTSSVGLTIFAPTNDAFKKLGPRINGFLFSRFGQKYLKAILEYHISPNVTLYSTHYDAPKNSSASVLDFFHDSQSENHHGDCPHHDEGVESKGWFDRFRPSKPEPDHEHHGPPFRSVHIDLPTLLENHSLPVDLTRRGPFVFFKVNGWTPVVVPDGLAADGVIHVVPRVLIPPKKYGGKDVEQDEEDISLEQLIERLNPFVVKNAEDSVGFEEEKWEF